MNKIILFGHISKPPIFSKTNAGISVLNFDLEDQEIWRDKDGSVQSRTQFHKCVEYGKNADTHRDVLLAGCAVWMEATVMVNTIERDGEKQIRQELKVSSMTIF